MNRMMKLQKIYLNNKKNKNKMEKNHLKKKKNKLRILKKNRDQMKNKKLMLLKIFNLIWMILKNLNKEMFHLMLNSCKRIKMKLLNLKIQT